MNALRWKVQGAVDCLLGETGLGSWGSFLENVEV